VQGVLKAAVLCCERIELNDSSVLVHCSDGWDRTSQMSATAMLCMDSYYRTIEGFAVLIEKEWLEFGHKFKDRHGQGNDKHPNERSPVFVQWLDAVHQIMRQYPNAFEFNERLLVFLADMVHSCLFGTFLGNCAKEREMVLDVKNKTVSIWTYVLMKRDIFTNNTYDKNSTHTVWPSTSIKQIQVWTRYFCRWDQEAHPRGGGGAEAWQDDWGGRL
jgi:myotubularin-related protein 1/2